MYVSTKSYSSSEGFAVCYRQWRAERKNGDGSGPYPTHEIPGCNALHGYALSFSFEFESETLDARNWVVDFGSLGPFKNFLKENFDHTMLVALDDPEFDTFKMLHDKGMAKMVAVEATGCEAIAKFLVEYLNEIWLEEHYPNSGIRCRKAEVRETPSNSAYYEL